MTEALITAIRQHQSPGGAFLSTVRTSYGEVEDRNCFVSGLMLRELAGLPAHPELDEARRLATAFLLRSQYPQIYPYCFAFWPPQFPPFWLRTALYADADDTSVIGLELVRAGHWPAEALEFIADNYLQPYRATGALRRHLRHDWQPEGVFLTWFTTADAPNPIDCCVNTNVVALLARAGLKAAPGYAEACTMINTAAHLVARHPQHVHHFTPYYPHPGEWHRALEHAVATGATELQPALAALTQLPPPEAGEAETPAPLCSDVSGDIVWKAPVLGLARALRREHSLTLS